MAKKDKDKSVKTRTATKTRKSKKSTKKPVIQRQKIRKYLNKYFFRRLKQYDIKYNSPQYLKLVDDIQFQLKEMEKMGVNKPSDYRTTVTNVKHWANQFIPRKYKGERIPPAPYIDEEFLYQKTEDGVSGIFNYWQLVEFFEGLLDVTNDLYFYSDTIYKGNIKSGKSFDEYHDFKPTIIDLIRYLNQIQSAIRTELDDYEYEVSCTARWRKSDGKGNYVFDEQPYWHRHLKRWQLEVMFCDNEGNKIAIPDWKIPHFNNDGTLQEVKEFDYTEKDTKQIADMYIKGDFKRPKEKEDEDKIEEKEVKVKKQEPKQPPVKEKEVELATIKSSETVKLAEIQSKQDTELKLKKLADIKDLFTNKHITFKEYMDAIKEI